MTIPSVKELLNLSEHTVLVTGGSGNLGRGLSYRLAEAGAKVIVHFHSDEQTAAATVATIVANGGRAELVRADLASGEQVERMFAELDSRGLLVDCVVNNAAAQDVQPLHDMTLPQWQAMQAVNLDGAFAVTQAAVKRLRKAGHSGAIVNIASIEGSDPAHGHAHYSTAKAGLLMLTRAAAQEYGVDSIRVNSVSPGLLFREGIDKSWPDGVSRWMERAPLTRLGGTEDVADAVLFLLSPAARWISGSNLVVDGGMSALSRW